jgi:hypothetical protein
MRSKLYVWSGSLRGVAVAVDDPLEAVDRAVRDNLPCVLNSAIRVSLAPKGPHELDTFFEAPYEDIFPDLFDGSLDVQVMAVEEDA